MNFGEKMREYSIKHGKWGYNDHNYYTWIRMRSRCNNPKERQYKNYGGRGITVCKEWDSYERFITDMGERPSKKHSLDRIDVNGNYCKENCRWATPEQQLNNKRTNRFITHNGDRYTLAQWAHRLGLRVDTLWWRLKAGWSLERALTKKI